MVQSVRHERTPEFRSPSPTITLVVTTDFWKPSSGEVETGGALEFTSQ